MALQKQLVSINLTSGLDTKTDARLLQAPTLTRLENGIFKNGSISKRNGSAAFGLTNAAGASIAPSGLALHGDKLICEAGGQFYAWASGPSRWEPLKHPAAGYTPRVGLLTKTPVVRNGFTQKDFDGVSLNGYSVYAWVEERPSDPAGAYALSYSIVDESSGVELSRVTTAWTVGTMNPRVLALTSTKAAVLHFDGVSGIQYVTIDTSAASPAFSSEATLTSGVDSSGRFDALLMASGQVAVAYASSTTAITLAAFSSSLSLLASLVWTTNGSQGLTLTHNPTTGYLFLFYFDPTAVDGKMRVASLQTSPSYAVLDAGGPFTFGNSTAFDRATGCQYQDIALNPDSSQMRGVIDYNGELRAITYNQGGCSTATSTNSFAYQMRLVGRAAVLGGCWMVPAVNVPYGGGATSVERTGFLLTFEADNTYNDRYHPSGCAARVLPGLTDIPDGNRLASPLVLSSTKLGFLFNERGRSAYSSRSGKVTDITPKGVSRAEFALANLRDVPRHYLGKTLYIGGARPLACDGINVFEAGFALFPEGLSSPGGSTATVAVYRFVDAQGQTWRSAPSPAAVGFNRAGGSLPTLTVTSKGSGGQVEIEMYGTTTNGTVYYKINSVNGPTANTKVNPYTTPITGSNPSDTDIVAGELLYTTGNILESIAPPAYSIACIHQQRLFIAGLEDPYEFRFSTPTVEGEAIRFNEALGNRVPTSTGKITALASMDDKLIIFTERAAYAVLGQGPDNTGANSTYSDPQRLPSDVGCMTWKSVALMPDGLMFQSAKGICLLGRGLDVQYVGAPVEAFNGYAIRCATLVPDQSQVRFQVDSGGDTTKGIALVYDYLFKQWAVFSGSVDSSSSLNSSGFGGSDGLVWLGTYLRLRSDGALLKEMSGVYSDSSTPYSLLLETAWLKFSAVQGMQRVWRALLIGNNPGGNSSTLNWSVGYDYLSSYSGSDALTEAVASGSSPFQLRRHLRVQKCEALRFKVWDTAQSGAPYQGVEIDNITLEVGIRQGAYKLPSAKSA